MRKDGGAYGEPPDLGPWWARAIDAAIARPPLRRAAKWLAIVLSLLIWWLMLGAPGFGLVAAAA